MSDFRLKVFLEVRRQLSFSKAAQLLFITQPAVSRHIHTLEEELGITLFQRTRQGVTITPEGEIYAEYAEEILRLYEKGKFCADQFRNVYSGSLNIGASTTIAQYILPEYLAAFIHENQGIHVSLISGNTEEIEHLLTEKKIDIGFIEGLSGNPQLRYSGIGKDELVCVVRSGHPLAEKDSCSTADLFSYPWVLREQGSGSLEVLLSELKSHNISRKDFVTEAYLGSTESIKSYLSFSDCISFVSVFSVKDELLYQKLKILDIPEIEIHRKLCSVELHGEQSGIAKRFLDYLNHNIKL